jgi:L-asparaginase II
VSGEAVIEVLRGGRLETRHRVDVAVADARGEVVLAAGDPALRTYWRSAAKPLQLLPFVACGGARAFGFGAPELAVMAASHSGEERHRRTAAAILAAAGLDESALLCGVHPPQDEPAWRELAATGGPPTPLWNNCSGKHAGMLAHCRHRGWPTFDYRDAGHPLQREILDVVARMTGEPPGAVTLGVDGCGVPAFHLSLKGMATAYARLWRGDEAGGGEALPGGWAGAAREIVEAMAAEPWMTAGTGRTCTRVSEASAGRVVPKVGAAGIFCAVLRERGLGLALKVEDGSSRAAAAALVESLRQLDALSDGALARLEGAAPGLVRNHAGTAVGECRARLRLARPGSP